MEYIFGIPGEENLDMLHSLKGSSIQLILTRHEQAAGFMAATYGRLTGKPGVCLSTLGPGATNFVTAAAYAQLGAMPMLMITGQKPIKSSKQGQFQIVDVVDMMRPLTKYTHQIVSGDNISPRVREAFRLATEERPGAVHLEFPEDIAVEETESMPIPQSLSRRGTAEEKAIKMAVDMIEQARHPLLLVGAGANRKSTARMLRQFIDKTGIPFVSTLLSASVDPVYFPQLEVVGDIANSIWQIKERILPQGAWDFSYFMRVREHGEAHVLEGTDDPRFPVYPQRLVAEVRRVMPSHGIIALDNGVYKIWFARNYKAHEPNTVLLDNALATMGAGLPSAMASKLVYPDRPVMAICGDGGFMMNSQELETAVRLKLNLVVLILRDDAYGMIKWKQDNLGFDRFGLDFGNPDFVKYAESYGAQGYRVERTEDLHDALKQCISSEGVHLVDCPVDYSDNDRILNREIGERSQLV